MKVELLDSLLDLLVIHSTGQQHVIAVKLITELVTYLSADGHWSNLRLHSVHKLTALAVEKLSNMSVTVAVGVYSQVQTHVKLLWGLAHGCVELLDEVPANLVLADIMSIARVGGLLSRTLLEINITVRRHDY